MSDKDNFDEDYIEKTFNLYEEKSKTLTRSLAILLGVAIFFLFIIFIPYVSILDEEQNISKKVENIQNISKIFTDIQNATNKLGSTFNNTAIDNINKHYLVFLSDLISNYTENVNKCNNKEENAVRLIQINKKEITDVTAYKKADSFWELDVCNVLGITREPNFKTTLHFYLNDTDNNGKISKAYISYNGMNKSIPIDSDELDKESIDMLEYYNASWHVGSPFWLDHNSKNKIHSLFYGYFYNISTIKEKINLLQIIDNSVNKKSNSSKIGNDLKNSFKNITDFTTKLIDNYTQIIPSVTKIAFNIPFSNIKYKTLLINQTQDIVNQIPIKVKTIRPMFKNITDTINLQLLEYKLTNNSLTNNLKLLKDKENETSNRLKDIEFPFGRIPVSINEAISFFPIGLGIGFLICSILLADTIKLRKEYYNELTKNNKDSEKKEIEKKISIIAPLWIDPTASKIYQTIKFIIILMPLVFFGISIYYIHHSWDLINNKGLDNIFIGNSFSNMVIYVVSYIISIGFFIYGYGKIITEIRNYPK